MVGRNAGEISHSYQYLHELFEAGHSLEQILLDIMSFAPPKDLNRLRFILYRIRQGDSLGEALEQCSSFPVFDLNIMKLAETCGKIGEYANYLSKYYGFADSNYRDLLSQLTAPGALVCIALFVQPVPALVLGEISGTQYLIETLGPIIGFVVFYRLFRRFYRWSRTQPAVITYVNQSLDWIPVVGTMRRVHRLENFCQAWSLALKAGAPMKEALLLSAQSTSDSRIVESATEVAKRVENGEYLKTAFTSFSQADPVLMQTVNVGEQSGTLDVSLSDLGSRLAAEFTLRVTTWVKFLPKAVYGMTVILIGVGMVRTLI